MGKLYEFFLYDSGTNWYTLCQQIYPDLCQLLTLLIRTLQSKDTTQIFPGKGNEFPSLRKKYIQKPLATFV